MCRDINFNCFDCIYLLRTIHSRSIFLSLYIHRVYLDKHMCDNFTNILPCVCYTHLMHDHFSKKIIRCKETKRIVAQGTEQCPLEWRPSTSTGHSVVTQTKSEVANWTEAKVVIGTSHELILIFIVSLICDLLVSVKILVELIRYPDMKKVIFQNNVQ